MMADSRPIHGRPLLGLAAAAILAACTATDPGAVPAHRPDPGFRLFYDLALNPERAELRQGRTLAISPSSRAGSKYALGGWRTGWVPSTQGAPSGDAGSLLVPVDADGATSVTVRGRVREGSWLALYMDGEKVLGASTRAGTSSTHTFASRLERGEHLLAYKAPGGLEIEWVYVTPLPASPPQDAPPDPCTMTTVLGGGSQLVSIPAGWTLGHALEVPPGTRLRATVKGRRKQSTSIVLWRDGAGPVDLGTFGARPAGTAIDVDLGAFSGQVVRLDLVAGTGGASLVDPRIVVQADAPRPARTRPRNVILYLVDTLRADRLRAYEPGTRVRTPALERFVERAAVFERSLSQSNWTKPSVATLLSSLLPWQHGAITRTAVLPGSIPLLQEHLQGRGYFTAGFVTNSFVSERFGFKRGWDEWSHSRLTGRSRAALVADEVLGWLDERPAFQPFFLYVHTTDPHSPYAPPRDVFELYDADPYDGAVSFARDPLLLDTIRKGGLPLDERDRLRLEALYDGEVTYHDEHFGRIVEGLAARGLADETLVVLVADHGEELFDHGSVGHGHTAWQELVHVPIIVRWPGVTEAPVRIGDPAGLVDVAPTILDILGIPVPGGMRGRSLAPLLLGEPSTAPRGAVCGIKDTWRCLVAGRYKLLEHATSRHATTAMLFDLEADPDELVDVAPLMPLTLRTLRGLLGLAIHEAGPSHPQHEAPEAVIDTETSMQLRALGYIGD